MTKKLKKMSSKLGFKHYSKKASRRGQIPLGTKNEGQGKVYCQHCGRSVLRARIYTAIQYIQGVPYRQLCGHCEKLID